MIDCHCIIAMQKEISELRVFFLFLIKSKASCNAVLCINFGIETKE